MPHESTYFPTFPNCFKRLNCFSMVMMVYFSFHLLVVLFPILGSESLAFDGWYFHTIHVKKKRKTMSFTWSSRPNTLKCKRLKFRKRKLKHTYKEGVLCITQWSSFSHIYCHSENRTVISRFTTYLVNRFCHGLYDFDLYIRHIGRYLMSLDSNISWKFATNWFI